MSLIIAGLLCAVSVYAIDRIERMSEGPAPADPSLLKVVFLSGFMVLGIFAYASIAGQSHSLIALLVLPVAVAAILAATYFVKALELRAAAHLRRKHFEGEVAGCLQALQHDPKNAAAHARLSELYEDQGDQLRALEHGRKVCELEPSERNRRRAETLGKGVPA